MIHIKREVKLALTAIIAVIILIWGISFLKAKALFDNNDIFYGIYERVDGLKVSSSVIYRGYSVGQVNNIQFIGERFDKVLVEFSVGKDLKIPSNTIAIIESADLMGSKAINLIPGDASVYAQSGDTLQSQLSLGLMEQLDPLKQKVENVMSSLDTVLLAIRDLFDENAEGNIKGSLNSVGRTLNNVEQATGTLNDLLNQETDKIANILENINSITSNLESNNSKITQGMDNIVSISDSLRAVNLNNTIRHLNHLLQQTDSVVGKINQGKLTEFRQNPKKFINLSVFDFSSGNRNEEGHYGIAIAESTHPLPLNSELYLNFPDLKQIHKNGKYLYLLSGYANLKQARKKLEQIKQSFKEAYIVKID